MQQDDKTHLTLANDMISYLNEAKAAGYSAPFVASAATAAAAAYSVFAYQEAGVPLTGAQLDRLAEQFRQRMVDFTAQRFPKPASDNRILRT